MEKFSYNLFIMAYKSLILLSVNSEVSLDDAKELLSNYFAQDEREISIETNNNKIKVSIDNWLCSIYLNTESHIVKESQELVETFGQNLENKNIMASSPRRFEVICDDDLEMIYFNDYLNVIQELGSFKGAKVWEQAQQVFI